MTYVSVTERLNFVRALVLSGRLSDGRPESVRPSDELWELLTRCGVWNATHDQRPKRD